MIHETWLNEFMIDRVDFTDSDIVTVYVSHKEYDSVDIDPGDSYQCWCRQVYFCEVGAQCSDCGSIFIDESPDVCCRSTVSQATVHAVCIDKIQKHTSE